MELAKLVKRVPTEPDVTLVASDGEHFKLHRATLASLRGSGFFSKAFLDLPDAVEFPVSEKAAELTPALSLIYSGFDRTRITLNTVRDIARFCNKYDVPQGLTACDTFLIASNKLSPDNLLDSAILAQQPGLKRFQEKCLSYAAEHMSELPAPAWLVFMEQLQPTTRTALVRNCASWLPVHAPRGFQFCIGPVVQLMVVTGCPRQPRPSVFRQVFSQYRPSHYDGLSAA